MALQTGATITDNEAMKRSLLLLPLIPILLVAAWFLAPRMLAVQPATLPNGASWSPAACWFEVPATKRIECGWVVMFL